MTQTTHKPQRSMGQRMGIAAVILSISVLLSRILGFVREAVIAYKHGAGSITDAYYAAFTLPDLMNYFLAGGVLSITFIPLFSSYLSQGDEQGGWRLFSTVASTMGTALVAIAIVGIVVAPTLVPILNPGFQPGDQLDLAVTMTRIVIPAQIAFYIGGLLQATLFVREIFWPSAIAPLIYNACIILGGLLLDPWIGIQGFSVGVVVGAILGPLAIPMWASWKHIRFRFRFSLRDPEFKYFIVLTLPLMIGVSLVTVDEWLLRYFGSMQQEGSISWLNNARKLMLVAFAVIGQAVGQAALPFLTRLFHEGKSHEMGQMLSSGLQRIGFLASIASAALIVAAQPLVFLIFRRGQYSWDDAQITSSLLIVFSLGLVGWCAQALSVRGFYARKDTWTPMLISSVVVAISLPIYYLLNQKFGILGLAMATSLGVTMNATATIAVYRYRTSALPLKPVLTGLGRGIVFGGLCLGAATLAHAGLWNDPADVEASFSANLVQLLVLASVFTLTAGILAWVIKPPELDIILKRVMAKIRPT